MEEALDHGAVEDSDQGQRDGVTKGKEATIEGPPLVYILVQLLVDAGRAELSGKRVLDDGVGQDAGDVTYQDDKPHQECDHPRVTFVTNRHGTDGMDDGQVAVQGHEHQGVDGTVSSHIDDILVDLTPDHAEWPQRHSIDGSGERDTDQDEQQVRHGQVQDQDVGGVAHLLIEDDHDEDEHVSNETQDGD